MSERYDQSLRKKVFKTPIEYYDARRLIYTHADRLSHMLEYGRSRLRICRGWALNAVLILITLNGFIWARIVDRQSKVELSIFGSIAIGLFALANWFAWRQLSQVNYRKVQEQATFLRSIESADEQEALRDADNDPKSVEK